MLKFFSSPPPLSTELIKITESRQDSSLTSLDCTHLLIIVDLIQRGFLLYRILRKHVSLTHRHGVLRGWLVTVVGEINDNVAVGGLLLLRHGVRLVES